MCSTVIAHKDHLLYRLVTPLARSAEGCTVKNNYSSATEVNRLLFVNLCPVFSSLVRHPLRMGTCLARADERCKGLRAGTIWGLHIAGLARHERVLVRDSQAADLGL